MINQSCIHFNNCGGCFFDKINSSPYKKAKQDYLLQNLEKLVEIDKNLSSKIDFIWLNLYSRRKVNFQINRQGELGFFTQKTHNFIKIEQCLICDQEIFDLKNKIENLLKTIPEKIFSKATITKFENIIDLIIDCRQQINYINNQKIINFAKENKINLYLKLNDEEPAPAYLERASFIKIDNYKLHLNPNIFIQASTSGLQEIISKIKDFINQLDNSQNYKVADIYSGFGTYSFAINKLVKKVTAFEGSEAMVDLVKRNINENFLHNKIAINQQNLYQNPINSKNLSNFDLLIINPPRNGCEPQIKEIVKSKCQKLIYISCNPISFARDSKILLDFGFKIAKLIALDQFVGSKYFELVSFYER